MTERKMTKDIDVKRVHLRWWNKEITWGWMPRLWINPYDPPSLWLIFSWGRLWIEYCHPWPKDVTE